MLNPIGANPAELPTPGQGTDPTQGPGPSSGPSPALDPIAAHHEQAKAQHDKVTSALASLHEASQDMDKLAAMGDAATDEDVLEAMAKWTANGADPKALIALMAGNPQQGQPPMPSGGEALASWIKEHDSQMKQQMVQLSAVHEQTANELGTSALRVLAAKHMQQRGSQPMSMPAPQQQPEPQQQQVPNSLH